MDYRYGSHTVFQIEYHFVWVTKYRYKVLSGDVARGVPAPEEEVLGQALLGERVLLRHGRADDRRDDQVVPGASLRAQAERRFPDGAGVGRVVQPTRIRTFSP